MAKPPANRSDDRAAIADALYRYVCGVDRRDWELVRSAYHEDACDDHGTYHGSIDGFIEFLRKRHEHISQSIHILGQTGYQFLGDMRALTETCFTSHQRHSPGSHEARQRFLRGGHAGAHEAVETEAIGRYVDVFEQRDGDWRISTRTVVFDIYRGRAVPTDDGLSSFRNRSRRDEHDPLHAIRRNLGLLLRG